MRYAIATITAALLTLGMATGKADAQYTYRPQATTDDAGVVAMWYQKYLGRQPDAAGLQGWVNELRRGGRVEANILGSDEYFQPRPSAAPERGPSGAIAAQQQQQQQQAQVQVQVQPC